MAIETTTRREARAAMARNVRRFGTGSRFVREDAAPAISELRAGVDSTLRVAALGSFALTSGAVVAVLLPVALLLGLREFLETWQAVLVTLAVVALAGSFAATLALRGIRRIAASPRRAWERAHGVPFDDEANAAPR